jgi:hypothetical protein
MLGRLRALLAGATGASGASAVRVAERTTGTPTSSNRASSFHAHWVLPRGHYTQVSATVEVRVVPAVPRLYFFALQASFEDAGGRRHGGGHLGLQWHPRHPGSTAANWGGYGPGGRELAGSVSALPSALANANTRDYRWVPGRRYRLTIAKGDDAWDGSIAELSPTGAGDVVTPIRTLYAGGDRLGHVVVWSEVFADCDHPGVEVRWSDLVAVGPGGATVRPTAVGLTYQSVPDGGCSNTDTCVEDGVVVQRTAVVRRHQGTLALR